MNSVVVSGIGVTAPTGLGLADYWQATRAGHCGIRGVQRFDASGYPVRLAGEVPGFDAARHLPSRLMPQTDHMTRLALVAADWALADAKLTPDDWPSFDLGVITAASSGGFEFGQGELANLWGKGGQYVSVYQSFAWFYAVNTGQISIRHGLRGTGGVFVTEQAGGLDALAQARRQVRRGVSMIISGGIDGSVCPWGWVAQMANGLMSTATDANAAYLPFDERANGYVPGEGGALLVLEDAQFAAERGAELYGEIAGYAATFDPTPGLGREPGLRRAAELAIADAGLRSEDIGIVFADAAAVPALDRLEADAIAAVFGPHGVPVTAPKAGTGRLYSGAGSLDVAAALLALRDGVIPPTTNVRRSDAYPIDLVCGQARATTATAALVLARGYGGFNSAVVVRRDPAAPKHR